MKIWKMAVLFYLGGMAYMTVEFLWRGRSDGSMFLLGGVCFLILGAFVARMATVPLALRLLLGAMVITALELTTGLLINQDHAVWDYRDMALNFRGQICVNYSLLWIPLSLVAMFLYNWAEEQITKS